MDKIKKLPLRDFTRYCMSIAAVPSSYLSGLTLEEQLLWLCSFLTNEVIPTVNNNGEAVEELQTLYIELKNYVDNYFDNLDIQEEVNTKLEEMAQSGELAELISQYLEAQAVIGFNTCSGLAGATNLANGSFARTLGRNTYNDGYGAFYKIRTRINADVPDGYNIIELTNTENLVAQRLKDANILALQTQTESLSTSVNSLNNDTLTEFVVFGDSWSDLAVTDSIWSTVAAEELRLNLHNYAVNGAGFVQPSNNLISSQISTAQNDTSYNKNKVKYVVLCGGVNDYYLNHVSQNDLKTAISNCYNSCKTIFPNAKILFVNDLKYPFDKAQSNYWQRITKELLTDNVLTLNQDGYFRKAYFNQTLYHLTQFGQKIWASNIVNALSGGVISNLGVYIKLYKSGEQNNCGYIYCRRDEDMLFYNITFWNISNTNNITLTANDELCWKEYFIEALPAGVNQLWHLTLAQVNNNNTITIANNANFNGTKTYTINGNYLMTGSEV